MNDLLQIIVTNLFSVSARLLLWRCWGPATLKANVWAQAELRVEIAPLVSSQIALLLSLQWLRNNNLLFSVVGHFFTYSEFYWIFIFFLCPYSVVSQISSNLYLSMNLISSLSHSPFSLLTSTNMFILIMTTLSNCPPRHQTSIYNSKLQIWSPRTQENKKFKMEKGEKTHSKLFRVFEIQCVVTLLDPL
jgi:hypothetical protein